MALQSVSVISDLAQVPKLQSPSMWSSTENGIPRMNNLRFTNEFWRGFYMRLVQPQYQLDYSRISSLTQSIPVDLSNCPPRFIVPPPWNLISPSTISSVPRPTMAVEVQSEPVNLCLRDQTRPLYADLRSQCVQASRSAFTVFHPESDPRPEIPVRDRNNDSCISNDAATSSGPSILISGSNVSPPFYVSPHVSSENNSNGNQERLFLNWNTFPPLPGADKTSDNECNHHLNSLTHVKTTTPPSREDKLAPRRRVGCRGAAICAACGLVCPSMDQLNGHYARTHSHLLMLEYKLAQCNNAKTTKQLFQDQLDRLVSEKETTCNPVKPTETSTMASGDQIADITTTHVSVPPIVRLPDLPHDDIQSDPVTPNSSSSLNNLKHPFQHSQPSAGNDVTSTACDATLSPKCSSDRRTSGNRRLKCYPCPRCSYTAKWPTELQKHVMVHADSRPFICSICSTSYKWIWDLGRHFSQSHSGLPNPYKRMKQGRMSSLTEGGQLESGESTSESFTEYTQHCNQ